MSSIQSSINSIVATTAAAATGVGKISEIPNQIKLEDISLEKQQFNAQGNLERATNAANKANLAVKGSKGKTADQMTKIYHDQERANKALEIAQKNLDAIVFQREILAKRLSKFGGKE